MIGHGPNKGIIPIAADEIFKRIRQDSSGERSYEVQVSMAEIYMEKVHDLLVPAEKRPAGGLKIRESKTLGVYVQDLSKHPVDSYEAIEGLMDYGYRQRSIGSTQMNANSSRAHTIITIELGQKGIIGGVESERFAVISLIDLAGSEKAG